MFGNLNRKLVAGLTGVATTTFITQKLTKSRKEALNEALKPKIPTKIPDFIRQIPRSTN
jgi:hypothetical protein